MLGERQAQTASTDYWNHNTAYHSWILRQAAGKNRALDVGCGDGLLVKRLSGVCGSVLGIDPHQPSIRRGQARLAGVDSARLAALSFEELTAEPGSFDLIVFAASLHHMDQARCLAKAADLLAIGGRLLVVGLARPESVWDWCVEALRVIPARAGSLLHGEKRSGGIGVPTAPPELSFAQIRAITARVLPGAKIRRGLYYRYLLSWTKL